MSLGQTGRLLLMARDEKEVVPNWSIPDPAGGDWSPGYLRGDPQVTRTSSIEVESSSDIHPGERLGCKRGAKIGKGGTLGDAEGPPVPAVPCDEGPRAPLPIIQALDFYVILDEKGARLE